MKIPFIGGAYEARSPNLNAQKCINLFPVIDQQEAKHVIALYGTPGLKTWVDTSSANAIRGLHKMGDFIFAVTGNVVYKYDVFKGKTTISGTLSTSSGRVFMADNGTYLMITDGSYGYYVTSDILTQITDADFPTPSSVAFQDGYFIVTAANTDSFYISSLNDPSSWDALDFASAEGKPDKALSLLSDHRELFIFVADTVEVFYNSGNSSFPFERVGGAFMEIGTIAAQSPAKLDNSVFWLGNDLTVRRASGYQPIIVSTRHIEYQFSKYNTTSDAFGYGYVDNGHSFYVLTFPTESATWVFDVSTGYWHQRASYPILADGSFSRHRSNTYVYFDSKHLVGDYENGKIYELDMETYEDDDNEIIRERACQTIHNDRRKLFFHRFEVEFEAGTGTAIDDPGIGEGNDPQAMLTWSDDGGHEWSNEHWTAIGKIGEYTRRAIWRRLGASRGRVFDVRVSDPVKVVMLAAYLDATPGIS